VTTQLSGPSIAQRALVILIGPSGSGKSTFAQKYFKPTQVVSSDACRAMVADDEADQAATMAAFAVLHCIVEQRLRAGRVTVVDATNVQTKARRPLLELAARYHRPCMAILFELPPQVCKERNRQRLDRVVGDFVVDRQCAQAPISADTLIREGFDPVIVLHSAEEADVFGMPSHASPTLWHDRAGSFDVIGDLHGCCDELLSLLKIMGYKVENPGSLIPRITAPEGRTAVFVGDFVDRGPDNVRTLLIVMAMVHSGAALAVPGNHDDKLLRALQGAPVKISNGLDRTLQELNSAGEEMQALVREFVDGLPSHLVLDAGNLVVAHAGLPQDLHGIDSPRAREVALFGSPTGHRDEFGLKILTDWAHVYKGDAVVVWGHLPIAEAAWVGNTIDIDTGCVHGGSLTALRYPERELVSVSAACVYSIPIKPL
jgi:protein phosphatase